MNARAKTFLQRWIISTLAVLVASQVVGGIHYDNWKHLLVATLLLGILNTFLKPILMLLSLPLLIFTLGLFMIVINALLLLLVDALLPGFKVTGFWSAFFGALVISIVSLFLNAVTGTNEANVQVKRGPTSPPARDPRDDDHRGGGPVIDV